MSEQEKLVGGKVKAFRESARMSQQDLANGMRSAGFKWAQATVWNVESGERPLRVTEAASLAIQFGINPAEFFTSTPSASDTKAGLVLAIRTLESLLDAK